MIVQARGWFLHSSNPQKHVESQQNNIVPGRCSNVIFLTFNSKLPAGQLANSSAALFACTERRRKSTAIGYPREHKIADISAMYAIAKFNLICMPCFTNIINLIKDLHNEIQCKFEQGF